jgi:hypothetical protein
MLKWIRNSKASKTNKTSKYRGVRINHGKYKAEIILTRHNRQGERIVTNYSIGVFDTEKEAVDARVKFILDIL